MKSERLGTNTSKVEILNISKEGIWLYAASKEYFLSCKDFPWFKDAKISEIYNVRLLHGRHLRWENLDVDLELKSLENLSQYPLTYH